MCGWVAREEEKVDEEAALRAKDIEKKRRQGAETEYELHVRRQTSMLRRATI